VELPTTQCARARESLSAQLDGELSEPELDRLETHLLICPECAAWAEDVREITAHLRAADVAVPAERFAFPRLRRSWRVSSAVAVASAAAVVATMFVTSGERRVGASQGPSASIPTHSAAGTTLSVSAFLDSKTPNETNATSTRYFPAI
jgi:predicted anti-sigma-YlaC factor YlaD